MSEYIIDIANNGYVLWCHVCGTNTFQKLEQVFAHIRKEQKNH